MCNDKFVIKVCPICKKEFKAYKSQERIFCSRSCSSKNKWKNETYSSKILTNLHKNKKINEKRRNSIKQTTETEEYKNKLKSQWLHNKNMGMRGKKHTEETKEKLSISHSGKKLIFSDEHKVKLSNALRGKKKTKYCIEKLISSIKKRTKEDWKKIQEKIYDTKKEKGSFSGKDKIFFEGVEYKCSSDEKIIFNHLNKKLYVIPQYKSKEYPFMCDFYIPKLKIYIEYQGFWTHGKHMYDKSSFEDSNILKKWKQKLKAGYKSYKTAIDVWTKTDPLKRKTAKENNLNWIEFFNLKEFMNWYNTIGEIKNG